MNEPIPAESAPASKSKHNEFRLGRVLVLVIGVIVVVGLVYGAVEYNNNRPLTYVKVTGRVMWDGKPVTIGAVMTRHTKYPKEAAIGAFDSEGKFELMTNGQMGASTGLHKVIVASYNPESMGTPLVPSQYLKMETTPLSINVTSDNTKNHFELEVIGEKPAAQRPQRPPGAEEQQPANVQAPKETESASEEKPTPNE